MCAPWRVHDPAPADLRRLVAVGEALRASGWRPHEAPQSWWRVEPGGVSSCLVDCKSSRSSQLSRNSDTAEESGGHVYNDVEGESSRPARNDGVLRRLTEEERTHGGVFIGGMGAPLAATAFDPQALDPRAWASKSDERSKLALYRELLADLAAGALEQGEVLVGGRVFVGPKERLIYDPAAVNDAIPDEAKTVRYGKSRDAFIPGVVCGVKTDLKAAFKSVPVAVTDRRYLGLTVDGVTLRYARLPFGLATSPKLFGNMLRRSLEACPVPRGVARVDYVDDIAFTAPDAATAISALKSTVTALTADGWRIACGKTFGRPAERLVFLGMVLDLPGRAVSITQMKQAEMLKKLDDVKSGSGPGNRFRQLQKLLGWLSWAAPTMRGIGFYLPALWAALRDRRWSDEADVSMSSVRSMLEFAHNPAPIDRPSRHAVVVADAGESGWTVAMLNAVGEVQVMDRGEIPSGLLGSSSTAREAVAAVRAAHLLASKGVDLTRTTLHLSTDSQALAACLSSERTRSPEVASVLQGLVGLMRRGMGLKASWARRSTGLQPLVDAATATHRAWHPGPALTAWLRAEYPDVDVHAGAGSSDVSVGRAFTSTVTDAVRLQVLAARPASWSGWVGSGCDFDARGRSVLVHPLWHRVRETVLRLHDARVIHVVTRRRHCTPDVFESLPGKVSVRVPPPQAMVWVGDEDGRADDRKIRRFSDLIVVSYTPGRAQASAERFLRDAMACNLHPGPTQRNGASDRPERVAAAEAWKPDAAAAPRAPLRPRRRASLTAGTNSTRPTTLRVPRLNANGSATESEDGSDAPHAAGSDEQRSAARGRERKRARSPHQCYHVTARTVQDVLRGVVEGAYFLGRDLSPFAQKEAEKVMIELDQARKARRLGDAAPRAARYMLAWMDRKGYPPEPSTADAWAGVTLAYARARMRGKVPGAAAQLAPQSMAHELSALNAALSRRGIVLGPYMGSEIKMLVRERGGLQRLQNASAMPIYLAWLLSPGVEPSETHAPGDHEAWASRVLQSAFALRTAIVSALRHDDLREWGVGLLLRWRHADKTRKGDVLDPQRTLQDRTTAIGHQRAIAIIRRYWLRARVGNRRVFPNTTPAVALEWTKRAFNGKVCAGLYVGTHGFRRATNIELQALGAPEAMVNTMAWWKGPGPAAAGMAAHYGSASLAMMMVVTSRLGAFVAEHASPSTHRVRRSRPREDWNVKAAELEEVQRRCPLPDWSASAAIARVVVDDDDSQ